MCGRPESRPVEGPDCPSRCSQPRAGCSRRSDHIEDSAGNTRACSPSRQTSISRWHACVHRVPLVSGWLASPRCPARRRRGRILGSARWSETLGRRTSQAFPALCLQPHRRVAIEQRLPSESRGRWAGRSITPANAPPDVLAAVGEVTEANDDDGVVAVIERLLREGDVSDPSSGQ